MFLTHGHTVGRNSLTYNSWVSMLSRCENPKAPGYNEWYGGKGIKVCKRWHKFVNFLHDMGERPPNRTLDRIDSNSDYKPSNCRWATPKEQSEVNIKTHCLRGHLFSETEYWNKRGDRCCKTCKRIRWNKWWAKKHDQKKKTSRV